MKIAGIDPSINGTGVVVYELDDELKIISKKYLGFTQVKKNEYTKDNNKIVFHKKDHFDNYLEYYSDSYSHILDYVGFCEYVSVEDYSYGSTGNTFNIGEYVGILKYLLNRENIKIRLHDPNSVKIFATGIGNADKYRMMESYEKREDKFDISVLPLVKNSKGASPTSDIIDAHWICDILLTELKLRKGLVELKELPEHIIKVFNRVTKAFPDNILVRDFL